MRIISFGSVRQIPGIGVRSLPRHHHRYCRRAFSCTARSNLYDVLGVSKNATEQEIKSAFKKKALKFHPDVNNAADAAEKFKEIRHAYQVLSDADQRFEHDRKLRQGSPFSSTRSKSRGGYYKPEPVYGLDDVFRDLGQVFSEFRQETKSTDDGIGSLWEELSSLGEEFVEFLEQEANITEKDEQQPPFNAKNTEKDKDRQKSQTSSVDDIEQTLQELKKRMGL